MIKNKALNIKNYFLNIFENIKNRLKIFQASKHTFILQKLENKFQKLFSKIIFQNSYQINS